MFHIGYRIKHLRLTCGLTQQALAKRVHISRAYLANLESGNKNINSTLKDDFANEFGVPLDYLSSRHACKELDHKLEQFFTNLLLNNVQVAEQFLHLNNEFICCLEQEVKIKLLSAIYYYKQHDFTKGKKIEENYLSIYLSNLIESECSTRFLKYFYLYKYEYHYHKSNYLACIDFSELLLNLIINVKEKAKITLTIAQLLFQLNQYGKALIFAENATHLIKKTEDHQLLASSLITQSGIYIQLTLYKEAIDIINELEALTNDYELINYKGFSFQHRGYIYSQNNQFKKALTNYEHAYKLAYTPELINHCIISLVSCHIKLKQFTKAHSFINIGKKKTLNKKEEMILLSYEGELNLYEGQIKGHQIILKEVLSYFEEIQSYNDLEYIYGYLASYYFENNLYKTAALYYNKNELIKNEKKLSILS